MGYGYPVSAPMEIPNPNERSPFRPEGPGMPEDVAIGIEDLRAGGLRLQGTDAKALPGMPVIDSGTDSRARAAAEEAYAIGVAYNISKAQKARSKAIARAKEKNATRFFEQTSKPNTRSASNRSRNNQRREKGSAIRGAQNLTGPSAFPYLFSIR